MQLRIPCLVVALLAGSAGRAGAFSTGDQFDSDPTLTIGGGGIAFNGAPRWAGHTCNVCHTNAPGIIGLRLEADHPEIFTDGYRPMQQYHFRVLLLNEWAGIQYAAAGDNCGPITMPYQPCDENGFSLEMDDAIGQPRGKYVAVVADQCTTTPPADPTVRVLNDGTAVTHRGLHYGVTQWDFCWTAPQAGSGPITAYIAAVDGNGGDGTTNFPNDTSGDDVAAGAVPIPEAGANQFTQTGGCNAGGDGAAIGVVLAIAVMIAGRRRKMIALVLALSAAGGCAHVRPRQRETLAKRNMKFAPDPAEDELDLHMQESREGSSGGYGSSGGGCGCN
jgi:uncharacterized protein (TIGR03382 family)